MTEAIVLFILRMSLGTVLLWAGAVKLRRWRSFRRAVQLYQLAPAAVVSPVAAVVVLAELGVGLALLLGAAPRQTLIGALMLFFIFLLAISINIRRNNRVECNCFGPDQLDVVSFSSAGRAALLLALALAAWLLTFREREAIEREDVIPSLTIAAGLVLVIRSVGLIGQVWGYYRRSARFAPTRTYRVSYRHEPLEILSDRPLPLVVAHSSRPSMNGPVAAPHGKADQRA